MPNRKDPLMIGLGLSLLLFGGVAKWSGLFPEAKSIIPEALATPIAEPPPPDSPKLEDFA